MAVCDGLFGRLSGDVGVAGGGSVVLEGQSEVVGLDFASFVRIFLVSAAAGDD